MEISPSDRDLGIVVQYSSVGIRQRDVGYKGYISKMRRSYSYGRTLRLQVAPSSLHPETGALSQETTTQEMTEEDEAHHALCL